MKVYYYIYPNVANAKVKYGRKSDIKLYSYAIYIQKDLAFHLILGLRDFLLNPIQENTNNICVKTTPYKRAFEGPTLFSINYNSDLGEEIPGIIKG